MPSNHYSNATNTRYGLTSAENLPSASSPNNLATVAFSWNPDIDNYLASRHDQIVTTETTETVWCPCSSRIREILLTFSTSNLDIVSPINDFLDQYFSSRKNAIIGLRASSIPASPNSHVFLPVVQWQEGVETEATAIFDVEESRICNALIHYGEGTTFQPDGTRWRNRRVTWTVRNVDRLKALFVALMPAVGKQQWQEDNLFNTIDPESDEYCIPFCCV